ncbi:hypothetical protein U1Q18_041318 [Sarracenia purpurea var. burkii]
MTEPEANRLDHSGSFSWPIDVDEDKENGERKTLASGQRRCAHGTPLSKDAMVEYGVVRRGEENCVRTPGSLAFPLLSSNPFTKPLRACGSIQDRSMEAISFRPPLRLKDRKRFQLVRQETTVLMRSVHRR